MQDDPDAKPLDESDPIAMRKHFAALNASAIRVGFWGVGMFLFAIGLLAVTMALGQREPPFFVQAAMGASGFCGVFALMIAGILRFTAFAAETRWRIATDRLRVRHFWQDDRPVPASTGRRMLRVFGRLAKHFGLLGIFGGVVATIIVSALGSSRGLGIKALAIALVGSVALIFIGYAADTMDGFLTGLYEEDDEPELDDLVGPREATPESDSTIDHDR